jgi:hypothetical protein
MVRATVVVCVRLPDVPVTVTVARPRVAVLEAVSVSVLVLVGLKDAVTPAGSPVADKATDPLKLLSGVTVTVLVPAVPWTTLTLLGEAASE